MNGSSTPDGDFEVVADLPVDLQIAGDMAYLQGTAALAGCATPADCTQGAAEIVGGLARGDDYRSRGFSRGLFRSAEADYLVAAIAGEWVEQRYFFRLDDTATDTERLIFVEPAAPQTYNLTTGGTTTAQPRVFATSKLTLKLRWEECVAPLVDADNDGKCDNRRAVRSRNPRLSIGGEPDNDNVPFHVNGTPQGTFYATAQRIDNLEADEHTLTIIGLASDEPLPISASLELSNGAGGFGPPTSLPTLSITMAAASGGACADICVDGGSTYTDDGAGPVVNVSPTSVTVATGATTYTLTGTLTDQVPIAKLTVNGTDYPSPSSGPDHVITSSSNGGTFTTTFSIEVPIVEGTNTFDITGAGTCGYVTPTATRVTVTTAADECAAPLFDQCTATSPGSVFWIDVVSPQGQPCQLRCAIDGTGGPLTCDSAATCN